jgi:hypothetical protein
VSGSIRSLTAANGRLWACGDFTSICGAGRGGGAELDTSSGVPLAFDPHADGSISAFAVNGATVYAGGSFFNIGGFARGGLAALDATTGVATAWDPARTNTVLNAIALDGSVLYVAGAFDTIGAGGGQPRKGLAGIDVGTGAATSFQADVIGSVGVMTTLNGDLYLGGSFTLVGGQPRSTLAAVHLPTGAVSAWQGVVPGVVAEIEPGPADVFVGGVFNRAGLYPQASIAEFADVATRAEATLVSLSARPDRVELLWYAPGFASQRVSIERRAADGAWTALTDASPDGRGYIAYTDRTVTPGGDYDYRLRIQRAGGSEVYGESSVHVPALGALGLSPPHPNPGHGDLLVPFSLDSAEPARLELLDVAGRRVESHEVGARGAGEHQLRLGQGTRLAPGVYVVRLVRADRVLSVRAAIVR